MSVKNLISPSVKDWLDIKCNSVSTSTIAENVAGAGVLIDGTKIKDFEVVPRFGTRPDTIITASSDGDLDCVFTDGRSLRIYRKDTPNSLRCQIGGGTFIGIDAYDVAVGATNHAMYCDSTGKFGKVPSIKEAKCNIGAIEDHEMLYKLAPIKFHFRKKEEDGSYSKTEYQEKQQVGFLAEDVEQHLPVIARHCGGKLDGVVQRFFMPYAVKCIQEQKKKIDQLEKRLKILESK